mgnify:CR=1 FL=1
MIKQAFLVTGILLANQALADIERLEEVTIIGSPEDAQELPSSAYVVSETELQKFEYTDINRMVRQVPGLYLQEEDGFGLRPNIGIRGTGSERSDKITLLEDGVLIAPAPYSAPAAYYFPTAGRMSSVEVLKGASILHQGPSTVGGIVNLISTRIPNEAAGTVNLEVGEYGSHRVSANYGSSGENWGFLVETHQQESDGFKDIDRSNQDSGFDIEDYVVKARINSDNDAAIYQQLDFKYQYSEETSDETYVGLTDADFSSDENRRYGLTELDEMNTRHSGANLRYMVKLNEQFSVTTTAYYNRFKRDWFKVDKVNDSSFGSVINASNGGDPVAQSILDGLMDTEVKIKHNNREYLSKGVQLVADWLVGDHQLEAGIRYHEDDVDRFQPTEVFQQTGGELVFDSISAPSSSNNRIEEAEALALHVMDVWNVTDALELTFGLRREDIDTQQKRYGDPERTSSTVTAKNSVDETLWSFGVTYDLNDQWQLLAGVHSGFAPASAGSNENVDPEESTNYEAGFRFQGEKLSSSAIAFYSDYESTILNCSTAFPCGTQTSGSQGLGQSEIKGLEFTLNTSLYTDDRLTVPLMLSYTYTDAEITDAEDNGSLQDGDVLRYVPENVLNAQIGLEFNSGWYTYLNASYIDEMCNDNSCGRPGVDDSFLETDSYLVFDLVTQYPLNEMTSLYLKVDNLLDDQEIVARSPGGVRPNKPRTATIGVKFSF